MNVSEEMSHYLRPHDALKHHFTSLKTDLILLQPRVLEQNFHETGLPIRGNFLNHIKSSSSLQVENCNSNSQVVVNEDDNGKCRLKTVKRSNFSRIYFPFI